MIDVPSLAIGVAIGVALTLLAMWARRASVTDLGAGSAARSAAPAPLVPAAAAPPSGDTFADAPELADAPGATTRKIVRRIQTRIGPGGAISIEVDGVTYRHLDDIPDARVRDQVRTILGTVPADVADPKNRQRVEDELRTAGIDPPPDPGSTT
jgi:hypothetical protein